MKKSKKYWGLLLMNNAERLQVATSTKSQKELFSDVVNNVENLSAELSIASNPFGFKDCMCFREELWEELAKCLVSLNQLAIKFDKCEVVTKQFDDIVDKQIQESGWKGRVAASFLKDSMV